MASSGKETCMTGFLTTIRHNRLLCFNAGLLVFRDGRASVSVQKGAIFEVDDKKIHLEVNPKGILRLQWTEVKDDAEEVKNRITETHKQTLQHLNDHLQEMDLTISMLERIVQQVRQSTSRRHSLYRACPAG